MAEPTTGKELNLLDFTIDALTSYPDEPTTEPAQDVTDVDTDPVVADPKPAKDDKKPTKKSDITITKAKDEPVDDDTDEPVAVADDEETTVKPFVEAYFKANGWEYSDDVLPEDSVEGMRDMFNAIASENAERLVAEKLGADTQDPHLAYRLYKYMENGGDPKDFLDVQVGLPEYEKIDVEGEDNEENAKRVIRDYLKTTNQKWSDEKINAKIKKYEIDGTLEDEAKDAKEVLIDLKTEKQSLQEAEQIKAKAAREAEAKKYIDDITTYVHEDFKFGKQELENKDKNALLAFMFQRDRNTGKTELEKRIEKDGIEARIKLAYAYMKNFDFKDIEKQTKTDLTRELKDKLKKGTSTFAKAGGGSIAQPEAKRQDYSQYRII